MDAIYLDHAATSPTRPEVVEAMVPYLKEHFGNPSSIHRFGRENRGALDEAREIAAASIHASSNEIVFTSGGTEADNMAIIGAAMANRDQGRHIITSCVEHHAVLNTCRFLEDNGFEVTYLPVDRSGRVNVETMRESLRPDTILASIMVGNNEVGTLQPIAEIAALLHEENILFHTDAVQAYSLMDLDVRQLGVDLLSTSAHKINGPKGIGFLYVKDGTLLDSLQHGGEQERKRRAGTENVAAIIGFAEAIECSMAVMEKRRHAYESFRTQMLGIFDREGVAYKVNGSGGRHLPLILNVYFTGTHVETLLTRLDLEGIALSSGSACTAGSHEPSHVLAAMYGDDKVGQSSLRFSFGYGNTAEEVEKAALKTAEIVKKLSAVRGKEGTQ